MQQNVAKVTFSLQTALATFWKVCNENATFATFCCIFVANIAKMQRFAKKLQKQKCNVLPKFATKLQQQKCNVTATIFRRQFFWGLFCTFSTIFFGTFFTTQKWDDRFGRSLRKIWRLQSATRTTTHS
jgi:hypothetical protein